jgi:hypothetical protein
MKKANFTLKDDSCCENTRLSFSAKGARDCCTRNGFSSFFKVLSLVFLFVGYSSVQSFAQCPITVDVECEADASSANAITAASTALMGMIGPCTVMTMSATELVNTMNGDDCDMVGQVIYAVDVEIDCDGDGVTDNTLQCNVTYNHVGDTTDPTATPAADGTTACGVVPPSAAAPTMVMDNCDPAPSVAGPVRTTTTDACGLTTYTDTYTITDACGNSTMVSTDIVEELASTDITFSGVPAATTAECYDLIVDNGDGTGTINGVPYMVMASATCISAPFTITSSVSAAPACPGSGSATITFTASLACGNATTAMATTVVTLDDMTDPMLTSACPPNQDVSVGADCSMPMVPDFTMGATASDNCDPAPMITQDNMGGFVIDGDGGCGRTDPMGNPSPQVGPTLDVDINVEDCNGNSVTACTVTLTPIDDVAPTITAPASIDVMVMFDGTTCVMGSTTVDATWLLANGVSVDDNMCDPNPTLNCAVCPLTFDCDDIGTSVDVDLTASDCNGNTSGVTTVTLNIVSADNFTAEWTNPGPLCIDQLPFDLTAQYGAMTPACGTWSGDDVTAAGSFNPAAAGVYAVTYTVGQPGCHTEVTRAITVNAAAVADNTGPVPYACETPDPVMASTFGFGTLPLLDLHTFLAPGYTPGGTWTVLSGPGFIPNQSGNLVGIAGCYEIQYAVTTNANGGSCTDTETFWLARAETPDPAFDLAEEVCWDGTAGSISLPTVYNGTTTAQGADAQTYAWAATLVSGAGPVPTFSDATAQEPTVDIQGAGTFEICLTESLTYTACGPIPAGTQNCAITVCHTLTVTDAGASANPAWAGAGPYCSDDATDYDLTALVTGTAGGIFTGAGVNSMNSTFNPNTAGPGIHAVTYTVTAGGCAAVEVHNIVVNEAAPIQASVELACATELLSDSDPFVTPLQVSVSGAQIFSQYSVGTFDLSGLWTGNIPSGGTWSLVNAPNLLGLNAAPVFFTSGQVIGEVLYFADPGCYEVSYQSHTGAAGGCAVTSFIYVGQKPVPSMDLPDMFCFNDNPNGGINGHTESADAFVTSPDYFNAYTDPTFTGTRTFSSSDPAVVSFTQTAGPAPGSLGEWDININAVGTVTVTMEETFSGNPAACGNPAGFTNCVVQTQQVIEVRAVEFDPAATCVCNNGNRVIDLGTISTPAGISSGAPFTIQFSGGMLDLNEDGTADVTNGTHLSTVDGADVGQLILNDQEGSWSITVKDNKGCEIYRSGECDKGEPTVASCPDVAAPSDAMACSAVVNYTIPTFDDATCDGTGLAGTLVSGLGTGGTFPVGVSTEVYSYTDAEGNSTTCSFTVTVTDAEPPTMNCPADVTVQCSADEEPTAYTFGGFLGAGGLALDNCAIDITSLQNLGDTQFGNIVSRAYSISDVNGLPALCIQTITINDTTDPVVQTCPNNIVYNTHPEECGVYVNWNEPSATDNCEVAQILRTNTNSGAGVANLTLNSGDLFPLGTTLIEYTIFDNSTNEAYCVFTVTVEDKVSPVIDCPTASAVLQKGTNNACSFDMGSTGFDASATDNCNVATLVHDYNGGGTTLNGQNFPLGNTTVNWTATDDAGNTSTCSIIVTVSDDDDPTVTAGTCPADDAVSVDAGVCGATYAYTAPTFDDNCDGAAQAGTLTEGLASGSLFPVGATTVTYEYTDAAGNGPVSCSFTVTVTDDEIPSITCPADVTVQCSASEAPEADNLVEFLAQGGIALDACGIDDALFGAIENAIGNTVIRTYLVTDVNGNSNSCNQTITIDDTEAPTFEVCPSNIVVNNDPDKCGANVNWQGPDAEDNCAIAQLLQTDAGGLTSGDFFPVGTASIEYTAFDVAGNETKCSFTVTVNDMQNPTIDCPTVSLVKGTNNGCSFDMMSDAFNATAADNCSATLTNDYNGTATLNGANFPIGNTTIVWTATDGVGNTASCSMTITVEDDDAPTSATCPADDAVSITLGACGNLYSYAAPTFDDNCDGMGLAGTLTEGLASGSLFPVGTTTVTYEYTDAAGNGPAVCSFNVTVVDDVPPVVSCPPAATAQCSSSEVPVADNYAEFFTAGGSASDPCGLDDPLFGLLSETQVGNVYTRTYIVSDVNDNTSTCTQEITVLDTTDPEFTNCPTGPVVVGNDTDECSAKVNWSIPVATDNCGSVTVSASGAASGSVLDVGTHTATYTATDLAGNTASCDITIMVMDTQDPLITACAADKDINNDPGLCSATVPDMTGEIAFIENCPGAVVTQSPAAGSSFGAAPGDQVTVTFTVTDASGNTATCTNTLTLIDNEPPTAVCANPTVGLDVFGNASVTAADLAGASSDNCGAVTIDILSGQTAYTCADVGSTFDVAIRVTDGSGNTAECTSTVTVTEGAATCVPVLSINDPCVCSVIPGFFDETVTVNALAGQTWTVVSATGLFSAPGQPIAAGTALTEGPLGEYILTGIHEGGVGYSITVTNEFGQQLSVANTCYLPDPVTITGVDDFSTACDDPFTVAGSGPAGIMGEAGTIITVDGPAGFHLEETASPYQITIDPSSLAPGTYTVCFSFDAGTAANNDPNDPGCIVTECEDFEIIDPVSGMTCNNNVNVSLDETCCVEITPDMVLEGSIGPDGVFDVVIKDAIGTPLNPANVVCANHIGMDLIVEVIDPCSGQSCWGTLNVEDKLAPELTCPADITLFCNQDTDPSVAGNVVVTDCSDWTVDYTDDETFFGNCEPNIRVIVRTFVAVDEYGNEASCTQTITVRRPLLSEIQMPKDVQWTCDNFNAFPNIINPTALHPYVGDSDPATPICEVVLDENCDDSDADLPFLPPNHTEDNPDFNSTNVINGGSGCPGFEPFQIPPVNGLDDADVLELTGAGIPTLGGDPFQGVGACMLSVTWEDEEFEICSGSFEILRTWKVRDMCLPVGPDNPRLHTQVIKVLDQKAPTLDGPAEITVSANLPATHPDECRAAFFLPAIGVTDNCSAGWTVEVDHPLGHIDGNGGYVEGLTRGDHTATYTVIDDCGNVATLDIVIHVVDNIAPTVQCDEITTATLSSDGKVTIAAEVFDDGTHDNCCLDEFSVRRMSGGGFAPSVTFNCNDINNSPIMVVMRAADCDGNTNECMVEVIIEDKLAPQVLSCPGPQRITCDFYWDNIEVDIALGNNNVLDQFGTPLFQDNCSFTVTPNVNINIDECGEGTITRTWQASDPSGNGPATCTQLIFVDHVSDFVVEFPADQTVTCTDDVPDFGEPVFTNESCELIAASFDDVVFTSVPDACYKISRTWKVINWCVVGDFVDQEVVEVPENELGLPFPLCDLDGDGDCDDRTFRDSWNASDRPTAADATQMFGPDTDIDSDPWDGYITYEQNIKVIDDVAPVVTCTPQYDVCIDDNSCSADLTVPTPDVQDCSVDVSITATSNLPNFNGSTFSATNVPPGTYTVTFQVMDNCGNSNACQTTVTVTDCKKPTPYCKNGIIVEIMQTGMIEVWANDLNEGSFDNCTAQGDLLISFSADTDDTAVTYTCDELGFQNVEIWITDEAGNQDFCTTQVQIQDNMNACDPGNPLVQVAGGITTEDMEPVALVDVELNGGLDMITTGTDGQYNFSVNQGADITITPVKDIDPLNGVTTFDLVLITKHILGVKVLDSPYKIIAADINKSETITTFDLVKLRKLILHVDDNFTNNTSWRFVDAEYDFIDPTNPLVENFNEVVSMNNVPANVSADFIAVKVGDVNGSANPLDLTSVDDRNKTDNLVFEVDDAQLENGETYTVDFLAKDFDVLGYQFTLNFDTDALELVDIVPGVASKDNFGFRFVEEGAITASWNEEARKVENGEVVFSLVVAAKDAAQLSDVLNVNSRYTVAEAYSNNGELLDVAIEFNGQVVEVFELYQNTPNPVSETTVIGFNLPQADAATLTITDATGRIVRIIEGDYAKGYNQVTIDREDLGATGVLYYQLETSTDTATKTMLIVE